MNSKKSDKSWLNLQFVDNDPQRIIKPDEFHLTKDDDPPCTNDIQILNRIKGSIFGLAIGDALGASVEFRPRSYLEANPVKDFQAGGTWGLRKGQFTDDTSMALCLANSLIYCKDSILYDQLIRYKWWYRHGYMSSTGHCFDIGAATRKSIEEFEKRQREFGEERGLSLKEMDFDWNEDLINEFDVNCSKDGVAGNGALMRLSPVPLFFYGHPEKAIQYSGESGRITHGDKRAIDACRYYGALIVGILHGLNKDQLLSETFLENHKEWFANQSLHEDIKKISEGSFKKAQGYSDGIRGKGFIVNALEAALWAFWSDEDSFEKGVLNAVNLGDDTDTTAAIYGQLAGAFYGFKDLPNQWIDVIYAKDFLLCLSGWIEYEGHQWFERQSPSNYSSLLINSNPQITTTDHFKERFSSLSSKRSNSIVNSMNNVIIRKGNGKSIEMGSLYNACEDSFLHSSIFNSRMKINQSESIEKYKCFIGDQFQHEELYRELFIDDEFRLSLFTNIIQHSSILSCFNYSFLIDQFTRIIFYSKSIEQFIENVHEIDPQFKFDSNSTHFIQKVDFGIEILIFIRLSSHQLNHFDELNEKIRNYLINNEIFQLDELLNDFHQINLFSNLHQLNQQKTLINLLKNLYSIKDNRSFYQQINFYLYPIHILFNKTNSFFPIKSTIKTKLIEYFNRFYWIRTLWNNELSLNEQIAKKHLPQLYQDLQQLFQQLCQTFQRNEKYFRDLIIKCRQDRSHSSQLDLFLSNILSQHQIDDFISSSTNFFQKVSLINDLLKQGISYQLAELYQFQQNDHRDSIQNKLLQIQPNSIFICSNDLFIFSNWKRFNSLLQSHIKQHDKPLVFVDFTYSSFYFNDIFIIPSPNIISHLTQHQHTFTQQLSEHHQISSNNQSINFLLLANSSFHKAIFINYFLNQFQTNSSQLIQNNRSSFLNSVSHLFEDDRSQQHFIGINKNDSNEYSFSLTQSFPKSNLIQFDHQKHISFVDPSLVQSRHSLNILIQSICHFNHFNSIIFIFTSNSNQNKQLIDLLNTLLQLFHKPISSNFHFYFFQSSSSHFNFDRFILTLNQTFSSFNLSIDSLNIHQIHSNYYSQSDNFIQQQFLFDIYRNTSFLDFSITNSSLHPFRIKQLIRPLIETLINCLRNQILLENNLNKFVEINPIPYEFLFTKCISCKPSFEQCASFYIPIHHPHPLDDPCFFCSCQPQQHLPVFYQLLFSSSFSNQQTFQQQILQDDLLLIIKQLAHFLSQQENLDYFSNYLQLIIDQELFICQHFTNNKFNSLLYKQLFRCKSFLQQSSLQTNHLSITSLIHRAQRIQLVQIQLNASTTIH